MPTNKLFKQHAAGTFSPSIVAGTSHCGLNDSVGTFRYDVEICYRGGSEILDANGFLLDNLSFEGYFASLSDITVSCEQLALNACEHFERALESRLQHVKSISVKLYPFGEVYVEATAEPARIEVT